VCPGPSECTYESRAEETSDDGQHDRNCVTPVLAVRRKQPLREGHPDGKADEHSDDPTENGHAPNYAAPHGA